MQQKPALDPNNSGNNCSVSNLLVKVKRIKKIIETKPRYLTSANSLDRSQLILKGKQHPDYPGGIAERTDECRREASGQADVFVGCSASFDISSSALRQTLFWGSGISDKAKRILTVICFFLPLGACDAFR